MTPLPTTEQMEAAAVILRANGIALPLPWEGDIDDREREIFHAFQDAIGAALALDRRGRS